MGVVGDVFALQDGHDRFVGNARHLGRQRIETLPIGGLFIDPRTGEVASHIGAYHYSRSGEREFAFTSGITALAMPGEVVEAIEMVTPDLDAMEPATYENTREGDLIYIEAPRGGKVERYSSIVRGVSHDEYGSYFETTHFHASSGTAWHTGAMTTVDKVYRYAL